MYLLWCQNPASINVFFLALFYRLDYQSQALYVQLLTLFLGEISGKLVQKSSQWNNMFHLKHTNWLTIIGYQPSIYLSSIFSPYDATFRKSTSRGHRCMNSVTEHKKLIITWKYLNNIYIKPDNKHQCLPSEDILRTWFLWTRRKIILSELHNSISFDLLSSYSFRVFSLLYPATNYIMTRTKCSVCNDSQSTLFLYQVISMFKYS